MRYFISHFSCLYILLYLLAFTSHLDIFHFFSTSKFLIWFIVYFVKCYFNEGIFSVYVNEIFIKSFQLFYVLLHLLAFANHLAIFNYFFDFEISHLISCIIFCIYWYLFDSSNLFHYFGLIIIFRDLIYWTND
jgi:hypothetical protein